VIFAFVDAAFVKPLPYREPSQLVALFERIPVGDRYHISYADYLDWKRQNRSFASLSVYRPERFTFKTISGADEIAGARAAKRPADGHPQRWLFWHAWSHSISWPQLPTREDLRNLAEAVMTAQIFAGEDPLGKVLVSEFHKDHPVKIIGIVDDIKDGPLDRKPIAAVYEPLNQNPTNDFYVTLRTSASEEAMLPAMVHAVHRIDSGLIANGEDTMADRISNSQAAYLHRSAAWVVAGFAALALLLGTIGLYGVIAYSVGQRTREIGVRMALGAQRSSVYQLILKEACWLTALGVVAGILCSVVVANLLRSLLFAVSPWDITTLLSVGFVLAASTLVASYIPARRAASIDPAEALRAE
jgi:hypothetical protein